LITAVTAPEEGTWPAVELGTLPRPSDAEALARSIREAVCGADAWDRGPLDMEATCELGPFTLAQRRLGAAAGGLEGLLIPRGEEFELVVDSEPPGGWGCVSPGLRSALDRHRKRFRVAHEWAHSLFYARDPHRRLIRLVADSEAQEAFCDGFAAALLVPPSVVAEMPPTPASVLDLQKRFDVSLEVALRAVVANNPKVAAWLLVAPEGGRPFVQWRSGASYASSVKTGTVMLALDGRAPGGSAEALDMVWLGARRQALVFART
jgi:hypothetical protein